MIKLCNKEEYFDSLKKSIENNFDQISEISNVDAKIFFDIEALIAENFNCLMFNHYISSVNMSNFILERLLKSAIIFHKCIDVENDAALDIYEKYDQAMLGENINTAFRLKLISEKEKDFLYDYVRDEVRNGFSHANLEKVLKSSPQTDVMYLVSPTENSLKIPFNVNRKLSNRLTYSQTYDYAKSIAFKYCKFLTGLTREIEKRLIVVIQANDNLKQQNK